MVGGQAIDLAAAGRVTGDARRRASTRAALEDMHARKTGALIRAAAVDGRRSLVGADATRPSPRSTTTRASSASRFRSSTTCSTSKDRTTRSARPPARTRPPASRPTRRSTASTRRAGWRPSASRAPSARSPRVGLGGRLAEIADWSLDAHAARRRAMPKTRLDQLLVARGLAQSRERARALILAGDVHGRRRGRSRRPARSSTTHAEVTRAAARSSLGRPRRPQARARARRVSASTSTGRVALDIGASTGGFTDVLLQRGARARRRARRRPRPARLAAADRSARRRASRASMRGT